MKEGRKERRKRGRKEGRNIGRRRREEGSKEYWKEGRNTGILEYWKEGRSGSKTASTVGDFLDAVLGHFGPFWAVLGHVEPKKVQEFLKKA